MDIKVLDFGSEGLETRKVHFSTIVDLLEEPLPPDHRCCRWINIKQPSPDVISILRQHAGLESLGTYKRVSKTLPRWDSNGYVGVPFPILYLDSSTNVPNEPRTVSHLQKEILQECIYIISNRDNRIVTLFETPDYAVDASVKAMISRRCSSHQMSHASSLLSAVIYSVVRRSVATVMTYSERIKTLELHVITQPAEQRVENAYLMLVSIYGMQRSLKASVRLIEALDTHQSARGTLGECERMVGAPQDGQSTISQDPCIRVVTLQCSTAISSLDTLVEVMERCLDHLLGSASIKRQRRAQVLIIVMWLLLATTVAATMLKLMLVR